MHDHHHKNGRSKMHDHHHKNDRSKMHEHHHKNGRSKMHEHHHKNGRSKMQIPFVAFIVIFKCLESSLTNTVSQMGF